VLQKLLKKIQKNIVEEYLKKTKKISVVTYQIGFNVLNKKNLFNYKIFLNRFI